MHSSQRGMPPGRRHTHAQEIKIWPFRGRGWSYIIDTYVVLLSMVILIRLYTAVHGTYLRVRCARTGVKVIYVSGSLSNVCLEHISLVISVPRTIIIITRVKSFPLQKHPWYVFPSAKGTYDIDNEWWVEKVLHSIFLHPSIMLVISVPGGTDITSEICSGAHISGVNIYHCNTGLISTSLK